VTLADSGGGYVQSSCRVVIAEAPREVRSYDVFTQALGVETFCLEAVYSLTGRLSVDALVRGIVAVPLFHAVPAAAAAVC